MKVAIDARAWGWTGIGRYIRELVREYAQLPHSHSFVLLVPRGDVPAELQKLVVNQPERFSLHEVEPSYYSWREQVIYPFELAKVQADLFHFPHFNVPIFFNRPYVVTIHDVTRFYFPGQRRQGLMNQLAYEAIFSHAVRSAKTVIAVSEHTAEELKSLRVLKSTRKEGIKVIYEGVSEEFFPIPSQLNRAKVRALLETKNLFLLYIGVWMSHKNMPRLLAAFKEVRATQPNLKLVMTGKPVPAYMNVLDIVRQLHIEDCVIFPGFVPHELLPALYAESEALVFPSLYEGFGLPALEAAAIGTPVVASNVSSLPEIMGDAAEYVNPEDVADIARGITTVITNKEERGKIVAAGHQRARRFSWRECAQKTLSTYDAAVEK